MTQSARRKTDVREVELRWVRVRRGRSLDGCNSGEVGRGSKIKSGMDWSGIDLPALAARYDVSLRAALEYVFAEFEPFAVIVSGSIVRGNPDPSSDFDILVLHRHTWRRRVQRWFEGVPAEIFVNSIEWMNRYVEEEATEGRPIMAHMLTTGALVYSSSQDTNDLLERARKSLEGGAHFSEFALEQQRYTAACLYEDAFEIVDRDSANAMLILARAVETTVRYWFASRQRFSVRQKDQLEQIRLDDPETAVLIEGAMLSASTGDRVAAGRSLARRVIGHEGFFEWDSGPSEPNPQ